MIRFVVYRALMAIPVLITISIVAFFLMEYTQVDRALLSMEENNRPGSFNTALPIGHSQTSGPLFYGAILPMSFPDTLYKIKGKQDRMQANGFLKQGYQWKDIENYTRSEQLLFNSDDFKPYMEHAFIRKTSDVIALENMMMQFPDSLKSKSQYLDWKNHFYKLKAGRNLIGLGVPSIRFYGLNNKFQHWITNIVKGNWGKSIIDNRPIGTKIKEALYWTLTLNILAMAVVFMLSIRLGEYLFKHAARSKSNWIETLLFFLHSIPRFVLALLLILGFASDTIHPNMHIFPSPGFIDVVEGASVFNNIWVYSKFLWLPILCMVLPSLAYISRLYAAKLKGEKSKPYAFRVWATGMDEDKIIRKHLRKNAILPVFALMGMEIPAMIGGSVVVEVLFNIPGMGRLMMQSIVMQDWAVVFGMLLITGFVTVMAKLGTDVFLKRWDSRITWETKI